MAYLHTQGATTVRPSSDEVEVGDTLGLTVVLCDGTSLHMRDQTDIG